jgi:hypothetical protein
MQAAGPDALLGILFVVAFLKTRAVRRTGPPTGCGAKHRNAVQVGGDVAMVPEPALVRLEGATATSGGLKSSWILVGCPIAGASRF